MNRKVVFALICLMAGLLLTPQMQAQTCPTNSLQALVGTWAFKADGFGFTPLQLLATAGRFTASIGTDRAGNPTGVLSITQTSGINGTVTRQETDAGRFQVNADCSGGTLTFNVSSRPVQYDFFFTNLSEIVFIGSNQGDVITGKARRVGAGVDAPSCSTSSLQALVGTWTFTLEGFASVLQILGSAGRFTATIGTERNGAPVGLLTITQTSGLTGSTVRLERDAGKYSVNSSCSGGTLVFNVSSRPVQLDFYFVNSGEIFFVGSNQGDVVHGSAKRATI